MLIRGLVLQRSGSSHHKVFEATNLSYRTRDLKLPSLEDHVNKLLVFPVAVLGVVYTF